MYKFVLKHPFRQNIFKQTNQIVVLRDYILNLALYTKYEFEKIRHKISYQPIAFELLPEKFTLTQLQHLYEVILNKKLDKRNFRKKMLNYGILKELDEKQISLEFQ